MGCHVGLGTIVFGVSRWAERQLEPFAFLSFASSLLASIVLMVVTELEGSLVA